MNITERFYTSVKTDMTVTLATADESGVTMRVVSPVYYDGKILFFTAGNSRKYRQLRSNPRCCVAVNGFFAQATASFIGSTMSDENKAYRDEYSKKFPGAFDEGIAFGGRDSEFILLSVTELSGWTYENDTPSEDGIPTVPFTITL